MFQWQHILFGSVGVASMQKRFLKIYLESTAVAEKMFLLSAQEVLSGVLGQLPTSWPKALLVHGPHECSLQIAF